MKLKITDEKRAKIEDGMIGLFFEDINYGLDGGLSAELIENRAFEFYEAGGIKYDWSREYDGLYGWSLCGAKGDGSCEWESSLAKDGASLKIRTDGSVSEINPHYLEFSASDKIKSFKNKAYDGICTKEDVKYNISMYIKAEDYKGSVAVRLGGTEYVITQSVTADWKRCEVTVKPDEELSYVPFEICLDEPGSVCFDFISMIPSDAVYGVFRKDLADMLRDLEPGFLRFPGGCIVEGNTIENMYRWKESVGDYKNRRSNWNRWAVHGNSAKEGILNKDIKGKFSHYNQTLAIGYYEYFLLCEYIGARPLPVANVGMACQYESKERFELEDPKFMDFINDTLDLIEFANGAGDTRWGSLRVRMGHEAPFNLTLLGIGNEQWETKEARFFERYRLFEKAIHEKYPDIKLIGSAGPDVTSEHYSDAWKYYRDEITKNENFVYAVDEHYYVKPEWLFDNTHFYDEYPRSVKVFAGEYASHVDGTSGPAKNCFLAALSEAAFLTGVERNADVVILASYAPLFARVNYTQWFPDMIWFDAKTAYGSPSYYVQKLYSLYTGQHVVYAECEDENANVKYSISYGHGKEHKGRFLYIKLVNHGDEAVTIDIELPHEPCAQAKAYVLSGELYDYNTVEEPQKICIKEKNAECSRSFSYRLDANSFEVLCIPVVPACDVVS